MSHPFESLIDRILSRAYEEGAFDNLSGQGKPLENLHLPKDAVINTLMRESKAKPLIVQLNEQIEASRIRLKGMTDEAERKAEMKSMSDLQTRLAIEIEAMKKYG
ncbi:MAG TPA: DnaJ family domain-containing protein [Paracoccaceae bacterium]|nr:DnaJ family domain-containing protein [Paracoccaceae bacterium]